MISLAQKVKYGTRSMPEIWKDLVDIRSSGCPLKSADFSNLSRVFKNIRFWVKEILSLDFTLNT
jgi:hypothetical protein